MKFSRDKDPVNFVRLGIDQNCPIDRPVNFVQAETDKIDHFLLQTVKLDRAVNFDRCRDGQNVPGFVTPQPFIEKN